MLLSRLMKLWEQWYRTFLFQPSSSMFGKCRQFAANRRSQQLQHSFLLKLTVERGLRMSFPFLSRLQQFPSGSIVAGAPEFLRRLHLQFFEVFESLLGIILCTLFLPLESMKSHSKGVLIHKNYDEITWENFASWPILCAIFFQKSLAWIHFFRQMYGGTST